MAMALVTCQYLACVASVSAGVCREIWYESKKKRAITRLETLATQASQYPDLLVPLIFE